VYAYVRGVAGERVLVALNFTPDDQVLPLAGAVGVPEGITLISTHRRNQTTFADLRLGGTRRWW
jgi:hypothetical protein